MKYLDLSDCDHISDKCLKWIASSCTLLTVLNLRFCTRITNGGLYDLSLGVQNFSMLKLSHCTQLTDASIIFFSENIKDLRYMYLRRCRKITENSVNYLAKSCPKLRVLDVTGCPNVNLFTKMTIEKSYKVSIRADQTRQERGVKSPLERGAFVAKELPVHKKYKSGPRDVMLGKVLTHIKSINEANSPSSKKKKSRAVAVVD